MKEEKFKQTSPLLERERNLDVSDCTSIINTFWELHFLRKQSDGRMSSLDPTCIKDHLLLSGKTLSKWEYNTVMEMDAAYRVAMINREDK